MRFDTCDEAFLQHASAWLRSLGDGTITDLLEVFRLSPGYYPTTLAELWRAEIDRRGLPSSRPAHSATHGTARLPVCHPGDYEWRFTLDAASFLLDQVGVGLANNATMAHLGTPTTFLLGRQQYPQFRHALLERNLSVLESLHRLDDVYRVDLAAEEPPLLGAYAAILDPPWYPPETYAFLIATNHVCAVGARIVLCQPTLATRPGVAEERVALLDELPRLGYVCRKASSACIRYQMPHFEASSLKATAPDLPIPDDWRTGDVLVLEKLRDIPSQIMPGVIAESWREVAFGPVRIKLRRTMAPNFGSLVPDDILGTVSRRDPIRQRIGLWTSGNRIFSLEDADAIAQLIELCHTDFMHSQFTLARMLTHARTASVEQSIAHQLFDLLLVELQEHTAMKGSLRLGE
jgi:hypothetical protein